MAAPRVALLFAPALLTACANAPDPVTITAGGANRPDTAYSSAPDVDVAVLSEVLDLGIRAGGEFDATLVNGDTTALRFTTRAQPTAEPLELAVADLPAALTRLALSELEYREVGGPPPRLEFTLPSGRPARIVSR